jgi:hypothetical protein
MSDLIENLLVLLTRKYKPPLNDEENDQIMRSARALWSLESVKVGKIQTTLIFETQTGLFQEVINNNGDIVSFTKIE